MIGGNIFDSIRNWFVKTAIKTTPIPMLQKGLKPRVLNKKTKETKQRKQTMGESKLIT